MSVRSIRFSTGRSGEPVCYPGRNPPGKPNGRTGSGFGIAVAVRAVAFASLETAVSDSGARAVLATELGTFAAIAVLTRHVFHPHRRVLARSLPPAETVLPKRVGTVRLVRTGGTIDR